MKIMVCGGFDHSTDSDNSKLAQFAEELAKQIVAKKHILLCGNQSRLDRLIIDAAAAQLAQQEEDPDQWVISYVPRGREAQTTNGRVNESANADWGCLRGRRPRVPEPIEQADALILLGGCGANSGIFTAANWAQHTSTRILPVSTFGMAARQVMDDMSETEASERTGLDYADRQNLKRAAGDLTDPPSISNYARQVVTLAEKAALSRNVFLVMSFSEEPHMQDYRAAIEWVCKEAGFDAVRTDTRPPERSDQIIAQIHESIENCGFVIADLTDARPNVYYEIGYARALGKKVILTSKGGTTVHFNLQGLQRINWNGSESLKELLQPKVAAIAESFGLPSTPASTS